MHRANVSDIVRVNSHGERIGLFGFVIVAAFAHGLLCLRVRIEKWGERLIDIDIIFFNNEIIETFDLCIPHKHMHERNFVLIPLNEIAPKYVHPKYNKSVADLLQESKDTENVVEYAI